MELIDEDLVRELSKWQSFKLYSLALDESNNNSFEITQVFDDGVTEGENARRGFV